MGKIEVKARFANDQRSLLHTAGSGCCKPPSRSPAEPWWDPGAEGPGSTEDLAFYNIKNRLKNHFCCAFFCVLLCVI